MGEGYASPSSFRLELEARRLHAAAPPRRLAELAPAVALSGLPQAFDLAVGAYLAVFILPAVMLPMLGSQQAIVAAVAAGSLAYAAMPVGRWLAAAIQARFGAGVAITAARFLLGASTAAIAFLPDAATAGVLAIAMLGALRVAQGVGMGALADDGRVFRDLAGAGRAWACVIRFTPVALGLVAAAAVLGILSAALSHGDMLDWGWRYPFVMAVALNVVALFAQLRLLTTDASSRAARSADHPIGE